MNRQEILQNKLEFAMTLNPDYICMAEVKGSEAFEVVEAAMTGHPTIETIHIDQSTSILLKPQIKEGVA